MKYLKFNNLFLVFLLGMSSWVLAQDSPPEFVTEITEFEVTENTWASFSVRALDDQNDMTVSFQVTSGHSVTLTKTVVEGVKSGQTVYNSFVVPDGSIGSTIVVQVEADDGLNVVNQDLSFAVTALNRAPTVRIIVDGDSGKGTQEDPFVSPAGISLGLEISDPDSGINRYGYAWDAAKLDGSFCPGNTMLMWNADVEPGLLKVGRMSTGGRFRIMQDLVDGTHVVHEEVIVYVLPAPDGCNPSAGLSDVSFTTNLPQNQATQNQSFLLIGDATSDSSVEFMMYSSSTSTKPVNPFYTTTKTSCSSGCTAQTSRIAPPYDATLYYWLDVSSGGDEVQRSLTVGVGGGGTVPPPTSCSEASPNTCSSCGSVASPTVDAGCPQVQMIGGQTLELDGSVDHPLFGGGGIIFSDNEWVIVDDAGLSGLSIENENSVNNAELITPEVSSETTVTVRLNAAVSGCGCYDDMDVILMPVPPPGQSGADLSLVVPSSIGAGIQETFDYSITVANLGPEQATGVTLSHSVPAGITYVSSSPSICSLQGSNVVCSLGVLPSGSNTPIGLVFTAGAAGVVNPVVSVNGNESDPVGANNSQTLTVKINSKADLLLSPLEASLGVNLGQEVELEYEVENAGPSAANNVVLTMGLPAGASVVSTTPQCQVNDSVVCSLGLIDIGASLTQKIILSMSEEGTFNSLVSVDAEEFDPEQEDNEATAQLVVTKAAKLVFPHSLNVEGPFPSNRYVGVAVFNPNSVATDVEFVAFNQDGGELGRVMLSQIEGRNIIPPLGQSALITGEILNDQEIASIIAQGTHGPVELFFMMGDYDLTSLDGIAGPLDEGQKLYFPVARSNSSEATVLFLFNSNPDQAAELSLELRDGTGNVIAEAARTLIAQGSTAEAIADIFGRDVIDGSVKVVSDSVIKGFEIYSNGMGISALTAQKGEKVTQLVAPHYFATHGGNTSLWLQNVGQNWADVVVKAYKDDGTSVGEYAFRLQKGGRFIKSVTEFLPIEINGSDVASGYLIVELEGGPIGIFPTDATVIGAATFTAFDGKTIATLPLSKVGSKNSRFLHVAQSEVVGMYTGLAILNLSGSDANLTVQVYDQAGNVKDEQNLVALANGTRIVDVLNGAKFFQTGFEQVGGHIAISSDQPVFIFALFGDYNGNFLSAIEGRIN